MAQRLNKKNSNLTQIAIETRRRAMQTGELPHEILLGIARGEPMKMRGYNEQGDVVEWDHYPTVDERIGAAVSAAPYFAPKLAMQQVDLHDSRFDPSQLSDDELDRYINELEPIVLEGEVIRGEMKVLEDKHGSPANDAGAEGGLPSGEEGAGHSQEATEDLVHVSRHRSSKKGTLRQAPAILPGGEEV